MPSMLFTLKKIAKKEKMIKTDQLELDHFAEYSLIVSLLFAQTSISPLIHTGH